MIDYDNVPDWVADNYGDLAIDFVEWIETETGKLPYTFINLKEQSKDARELWETYCLDRYTDAMVDDGDRAYDSWTGEPYDE